jgi:hypothetical protein
MSPLIVLCLLIGLPLVLTAGLRIKPLYVFVSIMCGYFWSLLLGDPAELILRSVVHINHLDVIVRIVLLLLPLAITLFLMRKTLSASALPFQFGLLLADSILLTTLLLPLLTPGVQTAVYLTNSGNVFRQAHDVLIAGIVGLHVLVMWFMRPRHGDHGGHSKHKKH